MARNRANSLEEALKSCFTDEWIRETAKETGYCKRERKIDVVAFFWSLVLSFGCGLSHHIADIRRVYERTSGVTVAISSFYDRFTKSLAVLLKRAVTLACERLSEPTQSMTGSLAVFKDLVLADATVVRLHRMLEEWYAACRTNHTRSAAKLHMVMSVSAISPHSIRVTSERVREEKILKIGPWVKDRLLLIDLGYFKYQLFHRIDRNEGFFISRLKGNANPRIIKVHGVPKGRAISLEGENLKDVLPYLKRGVLDCEVEVTVRKRLYNGRRSSGRKTFRVVGIFNAETGAYHLYITNVPPEKLSAEDIARTYKARWEVELLFKEMKSHYQLDKMPSEKKEVTDALIYAVVLTLIVSRALLFALRRIGKIPPSRSPERRWAAVFQSAALTLLETIHSNALILWTALERFLLKEMVDPNVNRWRNLAILRP